MRVISFGRASSNDVVVNDPMVSSNFHMKLIVTDDNRFKVVDCNSTNGTFVNGRKVPGEVYINRGDIIRIGNTMIPWETYVGSVESPAHPNGGNTQVATSESNPLALAGFICSFFVPVVGVVLSAIGLSKANKSVSKKGKGFAVAGLAISIVYIVFAFIYLIVLGVAMSY